MAQKILVVDDEPLNVDLLNQELSDQGYEVITAASGLEALTLACTASPDLMLLDYQMPGMNGLQVLGELKKQASDLPVIILTAHGTIERAVEAIKSGAENFVAKPIDTEHLLLAVRKALEPSRLRTEIDILSAEVAGRYELVLGESLSMSEVVREARKAALSRATILLLGESGTGKEVFARTIHRWSQRHSEPFVPINCVGLSKDLLESELFGHERGAFTGANQLKKGKLEIADRGTVFLDEVGDISAELQTKLLRFLQEREFERVGGTRTIAVDVRIIAATNRNLDEAVRAGAFREDLYHRLNVVPIVIPPLRERRDDILPLANHFLSRFANETKKTISQFTPAAAAALKNYTWSGNVRELANVVERAVVLAEGAVIDVYDLPSRIGTQRNQNDSPGNNYHDALNGYRRNLVRSALERSGGNCTAAARLLGLHRTHLMKIMKALDLA